MAIIDFTSNIYVDNESSLAFSFPIPSLDDKNELAFYVGNSFFKKNWVSSPSVTTARDGLGPHYLSRSCSGCHFMDGRGQPPTNTRPSASLVLKLSSPQKEPDPKQGVAPHLYYGSQLTTLAITPAKPEGRFDISHSIIKGEFSDGTKYHLSKPEYNIVWNNKPPLTNLSVSPRIAPHLIGLGLLEAIDESDIKKNADPDDANKDGISGKTNQVWDMAKKQFVIGRFGWKASTPTVEQQVASALINDMGITNPLFMKNMIHPDEQFETAESALDINQNIFNKLVVYSQSLAVPMPRQKDKKDLLKAGEGLFKQLNCHACHTPEYRTGTRHKIDAFNNKKIFPYTDLLLHDMGEGLADNRTDFQANGNEWKTPPLWGIGLFEKVNGHTFYLHDGRARNISQAIIWHGGEAKQSKNKFLKLSKQQRESLVNFVKSL